MSAPSSVVPDVSLRIRISEELYNNYSKQAAAMGRDVEEFLADRLAATADQNPGAGVMLKISPSERRRLETALQRSFSTGTDLTNYLESCFSLVLDGIEVTLSPAVLQRLKTRAVRVDFKDYVRDIVVKQVEHAVGMR